MECPKKAGETGVGIYTPQVPALVLQLGGERLRGMASGISGPRLTETHSLNTVAHASRKSSIFFKQPFPGRFVS